MTWLPILRGRDFGLSSMKDEMDRVFGPFLEDWTGFPRQENSKWSPAIDIEESDNEYLVRAEIPGMDPKEIDISLKDDVLSIRGEKKVENEENEKNYHYIERRYGAFQRTFRLPQNTDAGKVKAECSKGVLSIHVPKVPETEPKKIEIQFA